MDKTEIQETLEEIAKLLKLKGENPFKVRAHANAARVLEATDDDIATLVAENRLRELKGIGEGIANKIEEMVATGRSTLLDKLRTEFPEPIFELFRVPGLGPKKIKRLHDQLAITTLDELEHACRENRLADLQGFGPITQENFLQGIKIVQQYAGRYLIHRAQAAASELLTFLRKHPLVKRAEIAGSLRRRMETVRQLDLVASCAPSARAQVTEDFCGRDEVTEIIDKGGTKTSVRLSSGLAVNFRLVGDAEFPFALLHLTGSKKHHVVLRQRASERGLELNEHGLFNGNTSVTAENETAVFTALDLPFIPPELREDRGEFAAAEEGTLPDLIKTDDLRGVLHVHSTYSDGRNTIRELIEHCRELGFQYLGLCDHSRSAGYAGGLSIERIEKQHHEINNLNNEYDDFTVFKGIEADILGDGRLDYPDEILDEFDFVIASVHSRLQMSEPEATKRLIRAMENPSTTILGHLTGRLLLAREGYPVEIKAILDTAARTGTVIELNASPHRLDLDWRHLRAARDRGIKISINPDAHSLAGIEDVRYGIGVARKGWLRATDVINTRTADEISRLFSTSRNRH